MKFFAKLSIVSLIAANSITANTDKDDIWEDVKWTMKEFNNNFPGAYNEEKLDIIFATKSFMKVVDPKSNKLRDAHAECHINRRTGHNTIKINKKWWKSETNKWRKRKVFLHELGHCVLDLRHPKNRYEYTVMNQILDTINPDGSNWGYLMGELKMRWMKANN